MRRYEESKGGFSAVEFGLILPIIASLLLLLVIGADAMRVYSTLVEASREGARLVLMEGDATNVPALVESVSAGVPPEALQTQVVEGVAQVSVEVSCVYTPFMGSSGVLKNFMDEESMVMVARTVMPLP